MISGVGSFDSIGSSSTGWASRSMSGTARAATEDIARRRRYASSPVGAKGVVEGVASMVEVVNTGGGRGLYRSSSSASLRPGES